jgi:hypothetical protein
MTSDLLFPVQEQYSTIINITHPGKHLQGKNVTKEKKKVFDKERDILYNRQAKSQETNRFFIRTGAQHDATQHQRAAPG